jgi:hypothetical protein
VFSVELHQTFRCVDIRGIFPSIVFYSVAFPFDEKLSSDNQVEIKDGMHFGRPVSRSEKGLADSGTTSERVGRVLISDVSR